MIVPSSPIASRAFLTTFRKHLLHLRAVHRHRDPGRSSTSHRHVDPPLRALRAHQALDAGQHLAHVARLSHGRRQADDVREAAHERVELVGPGDGDRERRLEVGAVLRGKLGSVVEAGVEQRVRRAHRVVHLVRHRPNQLPVGRLLELPQFLGQLLDEHVAAREAAVEERPVMAADAAAAPQRDDRRLVHRQRGHAPPPAAPRPRPSERPQQLRRGLPAAAARPPG